MNPSHYIEVHRCAAEELFAIGRTVVLQFGTHEARFACPERYKLKWRDEWRAQLNAWGALIPGGSPWFQTKFFVLPPGKDLL